MAERDRSTPMERYRSAQADINKDADEAQPFTFQIFKSVFHNKILPENQRKWDWTTEFVPKLSKPKIRKEKLDAIAMVPARYEMNTTRTAGNIISYTMLALDFDNPNVNSKGHPIDPIHPRGFYTMAQDKYKFECLIYTTFSNVEATYDKNSDNPMENLGRKVVHPGHPKFRVIIPLKRPITVDYLRDATPLLMKMFPDADPHSFVPNQCSFLPTVSKENEHQFSCYSVRGKLFDLQGLKSEVYIAKGSDEQSKMQKKIAQKENAIFGSDSLDDAELYLSRTDPDLPHREWLSIGFCLRAIYAPRGLDEEAFQLFYEWSRPGKTFNDRNGLMRRNWDNYWVEDAVYTSFGYIVNQSKRFPR